jgi:hypothetical protein
MKRHDTFILVGVILAAGTAAFCVGRVAALRQKAHATGTPAEWLRGASPEAARTEQRFERQVRQRMDEVRAKQAVLASMLPDNRFTGAQILGQVDDIAQAYATLARSVGGHVAHLRSTLPEAGRQQVMRSCADSLRGCMQRRYRWRGGAQNQGQGFMGGRGGGWSRGPGGPGAGYGRQYRGGRNEGMQGLAGRLRLTQEQSAWIRQQDPNFEEQCVVLRDRLYEAHAGLIAGLENAPMSEQELAAQVDALIAAHEALEKTVARHIVLLRPQLSQEQRDQLGGLCRGRAGAGAAIPAPTGPHLLGDIMGELIASSVFAGPL